MSELSKKIAELQSRELSLSSELSSAREKTSPPVNPGKKKTLSLLILSLGALVLFKILFRKKSIPETEELESKKGIKGSLAGMVGIMVTYLLPELMKYLKSRKRI